MAGIVSKRNGNEEAAKSLGGGGFSVALEEERKHSSKITPPSLVLKGGAEGQVF